MNTSQWNLILQIHKHIVIHPFVREKYVYRVIVLCIYYSTKITKIFFENCARWNTKDPNTYITS